jgi:hypothetical protein
MSAKRVSIGQVMMVVALAAVNLAVARAMPLEVVIYPPLWVLMGSIDFLIIWKLILTRSLRAFHYTFLIVFVIAFFVMALVYEAAWGGAQPSPVQLIARMVVLGVCLILGGLMGLSRLKSNKRGREGHNA